MGCYFQPYLVRALGVIVSIHHEPGHVIHQGIVFGLNIPIKQEGC